MLLLRYFNQVGICPNVVLAVCLLSRLVTTTANANPIVNASFEDPGTAAFSSGAIINGWYPIAGAGARVWNINDLPLTFWTAGAPDGVPPHVQQTFSAAVLPGVTSTFSGYVGHPVGYGGTFVPPTIYVVAPVPGTGPEGKLDSFRESWTGDALHAGMAQIAFDILSFFPGPATMIAGALLLLPFGASTVWIMRKNRTA